MGKTSIEWTDVTWNPIRGCSRVSEGCRNCYAERQAARFRGKGQPFEGLVQITNGHPQWTGQVELVEKHLLDPLSWREPKRVFVNSMSDLFHEALTVDQIAHVFAIMAEAQQHAFQVLTKRPQVMARVIPEIKQRIAMAWECFDGGRFTWPLPNVWLGVSVENQETADERIPLLLKTPAAIRFVSYEPALSPVDLTALHFERTCEVDSLNGHHGVIRPLRGDNARLDWVIVGGESGPGARPLHPDWVRRVRDACQKSGTAFFFKQWGKWWPLSTTEGIQELPFGEYIIKDGVPKFGFIKRGKGKSGAVLDGREWREMPQLCAAGVGR